MGVLERAGEDVRWGDEAASGGCWISEVVFGGSPVAGVEVRGWDACALVSESKGSFLALAIPPLRVLVALLFVLERWRGGGGGGADDDDDELAGWVFEQARLVEMVGSEEACREPGDRVAVGGRD